MLSARIDQQLVASYRRRQTQYVSSNQLAGVWQRRSVAAAPEPESKPTPAPAPEPVALPMAPAPVAEPAAAGVPIAEPITELASVEASAPVQSAALQRVQSWALTGVSAVAQARSWVAALLPLLDRAWNWSLSRLRPLLLRAKRLVPARLWPDRWQTGMLYGMAVFVFALGVLVSWNGARANHQVAAQVENAQQKTETSVSDNVVPSTTKPSTAAVASYAVAPNVPRYIDIPKLGVHARILSEGLTKKGELQVPWNVYDTGWYNGSAQPGQNGAMLVDGHSGIGNLHGVFYKISSLVAGDTITITQGNGHKSTYTVAATKILNVADVNMADMLVSADTNKPGLNLITCAGERIPGTTDLNQRAEVYAVLQ